MLFPTLTYAIFFVLVLGVSWKLRPQPRLWKPFILVVSYVFYGWWNPTFLLLLVGSQVGNTIMGYAIARSTTDDRRRWMVRIGVTGNLVVLGFFKYYGFFVESLISLLRPLHLAPTPLLIEVTLPVGVSFFTFCAISYIIDLGRQEIEPANVIDFSLYLSFFPHLVAGPIVRASEFLPQLKRLPNPNAVDATRGARLIARGLIKKVIIASFLSQTIVDPVFGAPGAYRSIDIIVAIYAYAVQIYADFSGYTDIAIGSALLLGIKFPDNFDRPYTAATIQDFWRRWHMTLSRWLRDYLYIPLGGNRGRTFMVYRNLFLTMLLGGLWHGAEWTFVIWGAYHGIGLGVERWVGERSTVPRDQRSARAPKLSRLRSELGLESTVGEVPVIAVTGDVVVEPTEQMPSRRERSPWVGRLMVFHFVAIGWVLFRSDSLATAGTVLWRALTAWGSPELVTPLLLVTILAALAAQYLPPRVGLTLEWRVSSLPPVIQGIGFALVLLVVDILGPQGVAPFIYFQF